MTSDRELLELAAKAAGLDRPIYQDLGRGAGIATETGLYCQRLWNPLIDDGDALRLAVKLGITIDIGKRPVAFTETSVIQDDMRIGAEGYHEGDPYAATRRAIVRAAAEIGKSLSDTRV